MRVFVVGASGAIGTRLVPQLIDRGHEVIGTFRSPGGRRAGPGARRGADRARPARRARAVRQAVLDTGPEAIIHQATALAGVRFGRSLDRSFAPTNRLRTEGTDALLAAAREAGVRRFVAQSFASYRYAREGGPVKTEDDPLDPSPPAMARETNAAMRHLDQAVTEAGGIALRYGGFYGAARRRAGQAGAQTPVPDHRQRRRHLLVHPPRRRRRGDRARARTRPGRHLQHRRRRARSDARLAARAGAARSAPSRPAASRRGSPGWSRARAW